MKPWSYIWLEFGFFSTIIAIIRACACWALFVVTLTNTVHLIYIYIYYLRVQTNRGSLSEVLIYVSVEHTTNSRSTISINNTINSDTSCCVSPLYNLLHSESLNLSWFTSCELDATYIAWNKQSGIWSSALVWNIQLWSVAPTHYFIISLLINSIGDLLQSIMKTGFVDLIFENFLGPSTPPCNLRTNRCQG